MATATISMDSALLARVRAAAGENLSEWIAKACRSRLLSEGVRDAVVWEREHPAEAAAARTAEAIRQLETEAEREVRYQAEQAARHRGGDGAEPTAEEIAAAEQRVRAFFERVDARFAARDGQAGDRTAEQG
jgi:hypothetical protein